MTVGHFACFTVFFRQYKRLQSGTVFWDNVGMNEGNIKRVFICDKRGYKDDLYVISLMNALERNSCVSVTYSNIMPRTACGSDIILYIAGHNEPPPKWTLTQHPLFMLIVSQPIYDRFNSDIDRCYNYAFIAPVSGEMTAQRILDVLFPQKSLARGLGDGYFAELERKAGLLLKLLGIPLRLDGYHYLRFAVAYTYLKPAAVLKTDIYPKIAAFFNKNAACIERSMRYAIEYAWTHGDIDTQHKIFGYTIDPDKGKPVLRELISTLADRMRLENSSCAVE